MRLLLDIDVPVDGVAERLAAAGHDVAALAQEPSLQTLDDEQVLELATRDGSILVSHNVVDLPNVLRAWLDAGRSHAGVILVHGVRHSDFELVAAGVAGVLLGHTQDEWIGVSAMLDANACRRFVG